MSIGGSYDVTLVLLSILIAMAASYTALDLASRVGPAAGMARRGWLVSAALVMGGGIWAMHFVGMMAFRMNGIPVGYDAARTVLSFVVAVAATCMSFAALSTWRSTSFVLFAAGQFMGLGVVAMHYIGMSAMQMPMSLGYDRTWVVISVVIALVASTVALWLSTRASGAMEKIFAALVMGAAVSGMHYAGMRGASFSFDGVVPVMHGVYGMRQTSLALSVGLASFLILTIALVSSMFDRRLAEMTAHEADALRQSEERFRSLYRGTPMPLHSLDEDGRIEQISDDWLSLLGFSSSEVRGRPIADFMDVESAASFRDRGLSEVLDRGVLSDWECRFVTRSGEVRSVLLSGRVERDADGLFLHHLGGLSDVTERRLAEDALRQAQKIEAIGQLTGGVAHDFNNLLAVVVGNLDLLGRKIGDDPRLRRYVDSAMQGAQRGASLTQRLLAFARRQDLKPAPVDVGHLIAGMSDLIQRSLGPMIRVETHFVMGLPRARVDAHQLEMAILNLAVNARDAMPEGGLLTISGVEQVVDACGATSLPPGRYVRLEVIDEGSCMDAAALARATEPFFTTKGVGKGTGLGLSMVQGLAAQSGGMLTMSSEVGIGTIIGLWLPVASAAEIADVDGLEEVQLAPLRIRTVLVVDDDALVLDNTMAMLEDMGHRTIAASSGADALEIIRSSREIDLVVSDQLMPGMKGLQLRAEMIPIRPFLPFMLMSGYSDLADAAELDVTVLAKPFDQKALDAAMRRTLAVSNVVDLPRRSSASSI